ncbi:curli production assembly/transport component CsgF [Salinibacter ruber]|uniref:curli assembly protein CsgF n=1 Tax=Salinibacter ruber TaxID=146919 RepID=UPI0021684220|nr:curli assembly protein CsgF [Salinibacter ruber]MCS3956529.1 curli production assembly/transport component CsgF [Salinibacter ruber]
MTFYTRLLGTLFASVLLGLCLGGPSAAQAQEFVYQPINPVFSGSPGNTQYLLNTANNQNPFEGGGGFDRFRDDPLQNFEDRLQRQVLNQLSREVIQNRFGDIDLTQEGSFDFERFTVDVTPGPSGINIRVFNKQSGESTTVEVPRF